MGEGPLTRLIRGREFDQYQNGLRSRFRAYGLQYELIYCEPSDNTAMRLDFGSPLHIGRVTAWESGNCDLEALEVATGQVVFSEQHELRSAAEFHTTYPRLVEYMRDAVGWP